MLRLSACGWRRSSSETPLPTNPTSANAAIAPVAISTGWLNRCQASNSTNAAMPNSSTAFAIAARISRRR